MLLITSLTLNLTPNQMNEKNTDMNKNIKPSFKLLKSIGVSIKNVKVQIYIFHILSFTFTKFYSRVNLT